MRKLLERSIASIEERLVLLAPSHAVVPDHFRNVTYDADRHRQLVGVVQQLRGSVYLAEGNVNRRQLSADGLHRTPEDASSWHLLMLEKDGEHASSCGWYLLHDHPTSMQNLRVRQCPLASRAEWRDILTCAVESEIERARCESLRYAELGGWAVSKERRCTSEGLLLALAGYGLSRVLGGALGITMANVQHSSASILRRLGGSYLEAYGTSIPAYFDRTYNTDIEILRFDSRRPSAKYTALIDALSERLSNVAVFANEGEALRAMLAPEPAYGFAAAG